MKAQSFAFFLILAATTTTLVNGGVIPGRWEKVEALSQGKPITVILMTGDRMEANFEGIDFEHMTIISSDNREVRIPRQEVSRVEAKVDDGVTNGVLLGAAIGFAGPVIVTLASGVDKTEYPLGLGIGVIGAAAGGMIGWRVDKSHGENEVLYETPKK